MRDPGPRSSTFPRIRWVNLATENAIGRPCVLKSSCALYRGLITNGLTLEHSLGYMIPRFHNFAIYTGSVTNASCQLHLAGRCRPAPGLTEPPDPHSRVIVGKPGDEQCCKKGPSSTLRLPAKPSRLRRGFTDLPSRPQGYLDTLAGQTQLAPDALSLLPSHFQMINPLLSPQFPTLTSPHLILHCRTRVSWESKTRGERGRLSESNPSVNSLADSPSIRDVSEVPEQPFTFSTPGCHPWEL